MIFVTLDAMRIAIPTLVDYWDMIGLSGGASDKNSLILMN